MLHSRNSKKICSSAKKALKLFNVVQETSVRKGSSGALYHLSTKQIMEREAKYGAHNYKPLPVAIHKGKGKTFLKIYVVILAF